MKLQEHIARTLASQDKVLPLFDTLADCRATYMKRAEELLTEVKRFLEHQSITLERFVYERVAQSIDEDPMP